jgi:tetrapyrrole methylase family protein/MazG family protein
MQEFQRMLDIIDKLLGPNGCPWDREQTMKSIRCDLIEESCELVDAIDSEDNDHIQEELGDALFVVTFMSKLAEKEKRTNVNAVLKEINEKLVRRHPHVFGEAVVENSAGVLTQWNKIKSTEKGKEHRKNVFDSIPNGLPALAKAKKVCKKLKDSHFNGLPSQKNLPSFENEDQLGNVLFSIVADAQAKGFDAEHALRQTLVNIEKSFRSFEKEKA